MRPEIINEKCAEFERQKLTLGAKKLKQGEGARSSASRRDGKGQIWRMNLTKRSATMTASATFKID